MRKIVKDKYNCIFFITIRDGFQNVVARIPYLATKLCHLASEVVDYYFHSSGMLPEVYGYSPSESPDANIYIFMEVQD